MSDENQNLDEQPGNEIPVADLNAQDKSTQVHPLDANDAPLKTGKSSFNWGKFIQLAVVGIIGFGLLGSLLYDRMIHQPAVDKFYTVLQGEEKYGHTQKTIAKIMNGRKPVNVETRERAVIETYEWKRPIPFTYWPRRLYLIYDIYKWKDANGKQKERPKMIHVDYVLRESDIPSESGIQTVVPGN